MTPSPRFELFPKLPIELQRKIWRHTLPGPRIIRVHRHGGRDSSFYFGSALPPTALYICQTSREVACANIEAAFTHDNANKSLPPIYIDFAHDTLHLTTTCGPGSAPYEELAQLFPDTQKVQSLAIEASSREIFDMAINFIISPFLKVEGDLDGDLDEVVGEIKSDLREIVVVVGHQSHPLYEHNDSENVRFSKPETRPWLPWQSWEGLEAYWKEELSECSERVVVRFMEVKVAQC